MTDQLTKEILSIGVEDKLWTNKKTKLTEKDIKKFEDEVNLCYTSRFLDILPRLKS